jgi:hypothetical protein
MADSLASQPTFSTLYDEPMFPRVKVVKIIRHAKRSDGMPSVGLTTCLPLVSL